MSDYTETEIAWRLSDLEYRVLKYAEGHRAGRPIGDYFGTHTRDEGLLDLEGYDNSGTLEGLNARNIVIPYGHPFRFVVTEKGRLLMLLHEANALVAHWRTRALAAEAALQLAQDTIDHIEHRAWGFSDHYSVRQIRDELTEYSRKRNQLAISQREVNNEKASGK